MLFTGLNENEIAKITKILDECKVSYQVSSNEQVLERISQMTEEEQDMFRKQSRRSGHALMQIEIELSEFSKIPFQMKDRLHGLGIYEEVESPFTEEDFKSMEKETPKPKVVDPNARIKNIIGFSAFLLVLLGILLKKGLF